ncbi:MAG TPA: UDP-N-acetylmuramoyl-L-alanyl-D-glutamate--2,6-diaminopimelate ligase, partial [Chitinophagaceae bacterium]|nr:UDP-N-acetylmuramoyl-L-alanyl-D-glutamate--2,6-diaminopimelate ligase [Chitinophagaceae bacterium]
MLLSDVLYDVKLKSVNGNTSIGINGLQLDSRKIKPGEAFVAVKGVTADGHQFIEKAIENEAVVVVCEELPEKIHEEVTYVEVENSAMSVALMAHNFYGRPSEKLTLVGVTGTNGKTTIATLLYKLFTSLGYHCGLISTVENIVDEKVLTATHTTPDAVDLNRLLQQMVMAGCSHVFMETSSHALHQQRVAGLHYAGGIFSNITHDHLDYHQSFDEYIRVKKSFFDSLSSKAFAISNADDKRGAVMLQNTKATKYFYSLKTVADFKGKILENSLSGLQMMINDIEVHFRLIGEFNAYNLLAVYATAICLEENKQDVLTALSVLSGAEGRFDCIVSPKDKVLAIVDYAHTPD